MGRKWEEDAGSEAWKERKEKDVAEKMPRRKKGNSVEEDISNLPSCVNRKGVLALSLSLFVSIYQHLLSY